MGKTSLAMNMAEHCALQENLPVLVISLEMTSDELTMRLVGSVGRVDQMNLQTAQLEDHEWGRVSEAMEKLHSAPIDIQDAGVNTIGEIRAMARRFMHRHKQVGLIIVDYLQLVTGSGNGNENRATEVGQVSRGLKLLAGELQCPIIALSQLNRSLEDRPDKRPRMSDIRESGSVEQDADVIVFVYRDEVYTKEACVTPGVAESSLPSSATARPEPCVWPGSPLTPGLRILGIDQVYTMLDAAIETVANGGDRPVVHSDCGAHFRWLGWLSRMHNAKLIRSMSRKGCSPDNAACEGFFGRLKTELFYPRA
jgi:hypothetical protein